MLWGHQGKTPNSETGVGKSREEKRPERSSRFFKERDVEEVDQLRLRRMTGGGPGERIGEVGKEQSSENEAYPVTVSDEGERMGPGRVGCG